MTRRRRGKRARDEAPAVRPRRLSELESAILWRLLSSVDFPQVESFRQQIPHALVRGGCDCGCGTIDLEVDLTRVDRAPSPAWDEPALLLETRSEPLLMLFQADGVLVTLEHAPFDDEHRTLDLTLPSVSGLDAELQLGEERLAAIE